METDPYYSDWVLAIDGGGTHTDCVIAERATGTVLGRGDAGPSNMQSVGVARALAALEDAIEAAFAQVDRPRGTVAAACLGLRPSKCPDWPPKIHSCVAGTCQSSLMHLPRHGPHYKFGREEHKLLPCPPLVLGPVVYLDTLHEVDEQPSEGCSSTSCMCLGGVPTPVTQSLVGLVLSTFCLHERDAELG